MGRDGGLELKIGGGIGVERVRGRCVGGPRELLEYEGG